MSLEQRDADAASVQKAPRVTLDHIKSLIAEEEFIVSYKVHTICVLRLRNGYIVTGESACADPVNYNEELGRKIARERAIEKIWPLEGYMLREKLAA